MLRFSWSNLFDLPLSRLRGGCEGQVCKSGARSLPPFPPLSRKGRRDRPCVDGADAVINPAPGRLAQACLSMNRLAEVAQLVRVAHHVYRGDPAVRDLERGGLQRVALFDRDESRQAVDVAVAYQSRHP